MPPSLAGRKALVTGASRGIGAAIAERFAALGAEVAVAARDIEEAAKVAAGCAAGPGRALPVRLDVTDESSVAEAIATTAGAFGGLDCLVNNAGTIEPIGEIGKASVADWRRCVEVNLIGAYAVTAAAWPLLLEAGQARVINLSSGAAHRPLEGWSAYCASKAGLAMFSRTTDLEGRPGGIRSFGYAPGVVDTGMQAQIRASGVNEVSRLPRESLSSADEPALLAAYLASGAADDLAGQELDIRNPDLRRRAGLPELP